MTDILLQDLKCSPDAFANAVGDETVLLQIKRGVYFGLDPIGTIIWNGLNEGKEIKALCVEIAKEFSVDLETVESDARKFLEELKVNEIVVAQ